LPTNDPAKVIKGSEFTTEFSAIQSSFNLAAPTASPTFTGTSTFDNIAATGTVTLSTVDINGGTIDGVTIGGSSAGAGSFTTLTADGLTVGYDRAGVSGGFILYDDNQSENRLSLITGGGAGVNAVINQSGGAFNITDASINTIASFADNGDISFYEDTGTTAKFFWDASAEALGIGTSSPDTKLHVSDGGLRVAGTETAGSFLDITASNTGSDGATISTSYYGSGSYGPIKLSTGGSERMRIDSSGNVGIGTASPNYTIEVTGEAVATQGMPYIAESGTSRTLAFSDIGNYIRCTNAAATTVTIPPNASVTIPTGAEVIIFQAGAGQVTIAAGAGVTLNSKEGNLKISAQYAAVTCKKVATDTWDVIGDLSA
jgi:hypothetical protein